MGYTIGTHTEERVCFGELLEGVEGKVGGMIKIHCFVYDIVKEHIQDTLFRVNSPDCSDILF